MPAEILFHRLIKELNPITFSAGFKRRNQNYVRESSDCWGIINLQKSRYSASDETSFTINLAIASKRILAFQGENRRTAPPFYACPWEIRIGELLPGGNDKWWALSEKSYGPVASEVRKAISELAIPIITSHLSEEGLFNLWNSKTPGSFEYPRLKDKSILLAMDNEVDELMQIVRHLWEISRGKPTEANADAHIARLKLEFSLKSDFL